ncbi:cytosolic Fe-S cluster assembly factor cfd1 [Diatrype stigma]|uniref:Cytosolic Fe-S cluster assembly factor cfd1 n=1 Tax=Diatrype stigma TaxID=117547 RepID=A0AAN9YPS9_9PEZI
MSLAKVEHVVLVLSGKGGVGKSSVCMQLGLSLSLAGHSVGILDIDLTGPSIPRMFSIEDAKVTQAAGGWVPVTVHPRLRSGSGSGSIVEGEGEVGPLCVMSLGFLLPSRGDAVVWRGPKKTAMIRQFLSDVHWGALDYLLIDTPPGTGDEHIALVEVLAQQPQQQLAGAVVVTTPQAVAMADVRKELNFCAKTGVRVLGVVENMNGFVCPNCAHCADLFGSRGGGERMAEEFGVPFLGSIPIDPALGVLMETGQRPAVAVAVAVARRSDRQDETAAVVPVPVPAGQQGNVQEESTAQVRASGESGAKGAAGAAVSSFLFDKYRDCSLAPVLRSIAQKMIQNISKEM